MHTELNPTTRHFLRGRPLRVIRGTNTSVARASRLIETRDDFFTLDAATIDSAGAFLNGELERLDQTLHMPLASVTWSRDIDLREDVSIADEVSSFTNSSFAQAQGIPGSNKAWIGKSANQLVGIDLDIGKTAQPLNLWGVQLSWTLPELASAEKLGRPVDDQKYQMMLLKWNMDVDEQVYMGDLALASTVTGLFNQNNLTNIGNAVNGLWSTATPAQMLADVNALLTSVYKATGYAVVPDRLLVDPTSFGIMVSTLISTAGNISVLKFIEANSYTNSMYGRPLNIQPCKWLLGTGAGSGLGKGPAATNSMFAYVKDKKRVRFPLVPLLRTPVEYRDLRQLTTYYGRIGQVELVYPEIAGLRSNLT